MKGEERKKVFLDIGARLAAKHGAVNVQRQMVAVKAGCADSLVSSYMGNNEVAQKAYRKHLKKLGLVEPSKERIVAEGAKLRSHAPNDTRALRKRSPKEVEAIKRKKPVAAKAKAKAALVPATKPAPSPAKPRKSPAKTRSAPERKPAAPPERKTAARAPMAPPTQPVDAVVIPAVLSGSFP